MRNSNLKKVLTNLRLFTTNYPLSCGFAVSVWIAAFVARQLMQFYIHFLGRAAFVGFIWTLFFAAGVLLCRYILVHHYRPSLWLIPLCAIGIAYALSFGVPEERVHLLKFGFLAWTMRTELNARKHSGLKANFWAIFYCFCVTSIDELIQWTLPYRVGDIRDVCFGVIGATWGTCMYAGVHRKSVASYSGT